MIMPGAESFLLPGNNKKGVLLIHGYTGTPAELRELGEKLHNEGYTTSGPLLPGHGTTPGDIENYTWEEWYVAVKTAYYELSHSCEEISIVGMSMGSLLTLVAASELPVKKIVIMSTPIYLFDWRVHFLWFFKYFMKSIKKGARHIDAPEKYNVCYDEMPVAGVIEVWALINYCKKEILSKITVPTMIIQSKTEHTVKATSATYIYKHIASKIKRLVLIKDSKHVLTLYEKREEVFLKIKEFLGEENGC